MKRFAKGIVRVLLIAAVLMTGAVRASSQCMRWDTGVPCYTGTPRFFAVHDDGMGPALYFAEYEDGAVWKWTGTAWLTVMGFDDYVYGLTSYNDGTGPALYVGGAFTQIGYTPIYADRIAKLVGTTWTEVGGGLPAYPGGSILVLEAFNNGSGPKLYVGGYFATLPGISSFGILQWDGASWSGVGGGLTGSGPQAIGSMCAFDDGTGPALFMAGQFSAVGGVPANNIAKWSGTAWSALGAGVDDVINSLAVFDDGTGPALYAAGLFTHAGGLPAQYIARWNGSVWSALPNAIPLSPYVLRATVHDDGNGPALYFSTWGYIGSELARGVVRWDGSTWSSLGGGTHSSGGLPMALQSFDDGQGGGPALWVGGSLGFVGGNALVMGVARWYGGCASPIDSLCFGDGTFAVCPCANYGQNLHGCRNSASTSGALLSPSGTPVPDTLVLNSTSEPATSLSLFLQSEAIRSVPVTFGDGILCLGSQLLRLYVKTAAGGYAHAPGPGDLSITQRSAALGHPIAPGSARYYQIWYRDGANFCNQSVPSSFNLTNGLRVVW